jgi:hypothetical protein
MRQRHGSALGLILLILGGGLGCSEDPEAARTLAIRAHALEACPVPAEATIELEALGDFDASNRTAESVSAVVSGHELTFPMRTRAVRAEAVAAAERWLGLGELRETDALDVLLWREGRSCELFGATEAVNYPRPGGGQALLVSAAHGALFVLGGNADDVAANVAGLAIDVGTGVARFSAQATIEYRAYASLTEFGEHLLAAGGRNPNDASDAVPSTSAEIIDARTLEPLDRIQLQEGRAEHGAIVLPSGETLLVSGEIGRPTRGTLEAISPQTHESRRGNLATLAVPRRNPHVLRLSDGRIFVGGGTDADGAPVSLIEWLSPDASRVDHTPVDLDAELAPEDPRTARTFAALPGGGVLAVGGPVAEWITAEGLRTKVATGLLGSVENPLLIPASNGAPFLIYGPPGARSVLRFDAWRPGFDQEPDLPNPLPDDAASRPIALDPGAFAWIAPQAGGASLLGVRHGTRGRFARDVALLAETDPDDPLGPLHLIPDRPPADGSVSYDGTLRLGIATVFVTDADFEELALEIELGSGPLPIVLLGASELGGTSCAWPGTARDDATPEQLRVLRSQAGAQLERQGALQACSVSPGRLSVGIKGGGVGASVIADLKVRRVLPVE